MKGNEIKEKKEKERKQKQKQKTPKRTNERKIGIANYFKSVVKSPDINFPKVHFLFLS